MTPVIADDDGATASTDASSSSRRPWLYPALSIVFTVAGVAGLAIAMSDAIDRAEGDLIPGPLPLFAGYALQAAALVMAARAFVALFDGDGDASILARSVYISMLGRYIPGGIWQPASQVTIARRAGVSLARSSLAFLLFIGGHIAAAGLLGLGLLGSPGGTPAWVRLGAVGGAFLWLGMYRPVLTRFVHGVPVRRIRDAARGEVPSQPALWRNLAWNAGSVLGQALPFAILLRAVDGQAPFGGAMAAFAVAWAIGLAAAPVPAGIGVREAVLVGLLGGSVETGVILTVSVLHRVQRMLAEVTLVGYDTARRARAGLLTTNGESPPTDPLP